MRACALLLPLVLLAARPAAAAPLAYVTNEVDGTVTIFDTATNRVVQTVPMTPAGARPRGLQLTADGRRLYVANGHANSVSVIDAASETLTATIPVGRRPWGIDVTRDGRRIYTANGLSGDVSVIDTASLKVIATIPAGKGAWGVVIGR